MKIVYNHFDSVITQDFMQKVAYFEGFSAIPYICPAGKCTIGFGHTVGVTKDTTVTREIASELLYSDLRSVYLDLLKRIDRFDFDTLPLGLKQALVDFVFNVGIGRFLTSSIYRNLQRFYPLRCSEKEFFNEKICNSLMQYVYSNGKRLKGLEKRRQWECSLIKGC